MANLQISKPHQPRNFPPKENYFRKKQNQVNHRDNNNFQHNYNRDQGGWNHRNTMPPRFQKRHSSTKAARHFEGQPLLQMHPPQAAIPPQVMNPNMLAPMNIVPMVNEQGEVTLCPQVMSLPYFTPAPIPELPEGNGEEVPYDPNLQYFTVYPSGMIYTPGPATQPTAAVQYITPQVQQPQPPYQQPTQTVHYSMPVPGGI